MDFEQIPSKTSCKKTKKKKKISLFCGSKLIKSMKKQRQAGVIFMWKLHCNRTRKLFFLTDTVTKQSS